LSRRSETNEEFLRVRRHEKDRNVPGLIGDLSGGKTLVREHAARVLARLGASEAAPHIAELAEDPVDTVRMVACMALGVLKASDFKGILVAALDDPAPVVRSSAADALGRIGARDAIPSLRQTLDSDPDPEARLHAVESLVLLGDNRSRDRVPEALKAISWRVRLHPRWKKLRKAVEDGEPLTPWIESGSWSPLT
jgi:HEAT repeat protein